MDGDTFKGRALFAPMVRHLIVLYVLWLLKIGCFLLTTYYWLNILPFFLLQGSDQLLIGENIVSRANIRVKVRVRMASCCRFIRLSQALFSSPIQGITIWFFLFGCLLWSCCWCIMYIYIVQPPSSLETRVSDVCSEQRSWWVFMWPLFALVMYF